MEVHTASFGAILRTPRCERVLANSRPLYSDFGFRRLAAKLGNRNASM